MRALPLALLLSVVPLYGCTPPCGNVCRKVLDCGLDSERVSQQECETSCTQQSALYASWSDDALQDLYADHRRCLMRSSCEEIASGACYDGYEALFVFDADKQLPQVSESETGADTGTSAR